MSSIIKKIKNGLSEGIGFALGILIVFGIILSVYAFVEPSEDPSFNHFIDWTSPLNSKHNNTNYLVNNVNENIGSSYLGLYNNKIPSDFVPINAYTMICFKNNQVFNETKLANTNTNTGTLCKPGDIGFIIERDISATYVNWDKARSECVKRGMRLPEPFEFIYACKDHSTTVSFYSGSIGQEWASNTPIYNIEFSTIALLAVPVLSGAGTCSFLISGVVSTSQAPHNSDSYKYRCVK